MGAFFVAFAVNLPDSVKEANWCFNVAYTSEVITRYAYLGWLLTYFFVSAFNNKQESNPRPRDIGYDVLQSGAPLVAAYSLGFLSPVATYGWKAYAIAQGAIFVICSLSLLLFRIKATPGVNRLRSYGAVISAVPLLLLLNNRSESFVRFAFGVSLVLLWLVLLAYTRIRYDVRGNQRDGAGEY